MVSYSSGRISFALVAAVLFTAVSTHGQDLAPSPILAPETSASPAPAAQRVVPTSNPAELTSADLEPFLDGLINSQLQNRDVAGAVVSVVKDGALLLARGYGFADVEQKKRVVAEETLFRTASISKLFTAIAVMQLVEQGKLDLERDVREYLDVEIHRSFPEPITLRRILTHTAGFEEALKGRYGDGKPRPLREYLVAHMPAQIFRPGTVPAYSNYGLAVAGYIVERVANQPFDQYLAEYVFTPLRMTSSTFVQPLPAAFEPRMSRGYRIGSKRAEPIEIINGVPAGALSTTATDMSRFMLALLNGGTLDGATILQPRSLEMMMSRQNELHPALNAMCLGFIEYSQNGQEMWGHGGATRFFYSDMVLIPGARIGIFVSYNSTGTRPGGPPGVLRPFFARYFPEADAGTPATPDAVAHGREVSGVYESSRRAETTILRLGALLGQVTVSADKAGVLTIENSRTLSGQPKRWREVAPYVYRGIDGGDLIAFRRDAEGRVTDLVPGSSVSLRQRVHGLQSKAVVLPLLIASVTMMALTLLLWPVAAIVRKRYGRKLFTDKTSRLLFVLSRVTCLLFVAMIVVLHIPMNGLENDISWFSDRIDPWLRTAQGLGWAACLGILVMAAAAVRFWRTPELGWWLRVHATLLLAAAVTFAWFSWQWHLLPGSLKF